jgi:hypothetical protein
MTWPTTPINTTNLDNGADEPRLARADLKNMADAVNAMIAQGGAVSSAYVSYGKTITTTNSNVFAPISANPSIITAGATGITVSSNNIVIPAGTWLFEVLADNPDLEGTGSVNIEAIRIRNTTDSSNIYQGPAARFTANGFATFASTVNVQFQARVSNFYVGFNASEVWGYQDGSQPGPQGIGLYIKITKIA